MVEGTPQKRSKTVQVVEDGADIKRKTEARH